MIRESEHLAIVEDVKNFFKSHIQKMKMLVAKKQSEQNKSRDLILSLQKNLQQLTIELENAQLIIAEQKSSYSKLQQGYQQLKVDQLVHDDEINNHKRETGMSIINYRIG